MKKNLIICLFLLFYFCNNIYGQRTNSFVYSNLYGRDKILNLQWRNEQSEIKEAHIHDQIIIRFETRNVPDNEKIDIEIWEETDGKLMDLIDTLQGTVKNNVVEIPWKVAECDENNMNTNYAREIKEKGYTFIDFIFKIKNTNIQSKSLAILSFVNGQAIDDKYGIPIKNHAFIFTYPDNEEIQVFSDENGIIKVRNIRKMGKVYIRLDKTWKSEKTQIGFFNLQWRNEHSEIKEAHRDDQVIIRFETRNVPDNVKIDIEIWEETDGKLTDLIDTLQGTVKNNVVEIPWKVSYDKKNMDKNYAREIEENGYTVLDYIFKIKSANIDSKSLAIVVNKQ
jgi:Txe/YoeB family toxin of Txe-Axe toxin-antitoxin module